MVTDHMQYKVLDNETSNNFVPTLLLGNFLNQQGHQLVFNHELTGHPPLIAQKHNDNPLEIPFSYHDVISDYSADNYSHTRVAFKPLAPLPSKDTYQKMGSHECKMWGDKELFEFLLTNYPKEAYEGKPLEWDESEGCMMVTGMIFLGGPLFKAVEFQHSTVEIIGADLDQY
jgi:hypothetical protein